MIGKWRRTSTLSSSFSSTRERYPPPSFLSKGWITLCIDVHMSTGTGVYEGNTHKMLQISTHIVASMLFNQSSTGIVYETSFEIFNISAYSKFESTLRTLVIQPPLTPLPTPSPLRPGRKRTWPRHRHCRGEWSPFFGSRLLYIQEAAAALRSAVRGARCCRGALGCCAALWWRVVRADVRGL